MLEHLGEQQAANAIMQALNEALCTTSTPDMGGSATTSELAAAIVKLL